MMHKHSFAWTCDAEKPAGGTATIRTVSGSTYVCIDPECGEVRNVYADGEIHVAKEGLPEEE